MNSRATGNLSKIALMPSPIARRNLRNVDLNLLVYLDALVSDCHVSRAADNIGISQPAMSNALNRLRRVFHDPLLLPTGRGMAPTLRALELGEPIRRLLEHAHELLDAVEPFAPCTLTRRFTLMASDYVLLVLMPLLTDMVRAAAPGVVLKACSPDPGHAHELLASGQVDLDVGYLPDPRPTLRSRGLFAEKWICIAREGHPRLNGSIALHEYCELPHVEIALSSASYYARLIDRTLADIAAPPRRVGLTIPNFLVAPAIVARSDLIATIPERVARWCASALPLQLLTVPVDLPDLKVSMYWHERSHRDPGNRWLRELLIGASDASLALRGAPWPQDGRSDRAAAKSACPSLELVADVRRQ